MNSLIVQNAIRLIGLIGCNTRSRLGMILGNIAYYFPLREKSIALKQVKLALPEENTRDIVKGMYRNLGQVILESLGILPFLKNKEERFSINDENLVKSLLESGRPVVALTAHTGNWDLMAAYIVSLGAKLTTIGKPARNRSLQIALEKLRAEYGIRVLWRTGKDGTRDVIKELKQNRVVAALIDQDTRVSSHWAPFFNYPAKCPSGIIALAKKYNAVLVTCFNVRKGLNNYHLLVSKLDSNLSVEQIIAEYNQRLEIVIREHPEQWVWIHKRWRSPDENTTMSTSEYLQFLERELIVG